MIAFESGLLCVGTLLLLSPRWGAHEHHGVLLGAAAGILFGVSDVAIKALTGTVGGAVRMSRRASDRLIRSSSRCAVKLTSVLGMNDHRATPPRRGTLLRCPRQPPPAAGPSPRSLPHPATATATDRLLLLDQLTTLAALAKRQVCASTS